LSDHHLVISVLGFVFFLLVNIFWVSVSNFQCSVINRYQFGIVLFVIQCEYFIYYSCDIYCIVIVLFTQTYLQQSCFNGILESMNLKHSVKKVIWLGIFDEL
ncbi:hypothetical protein ACJX0J_016063, partial [Zea mays]